MEQVKRRIHLMDEIRGLCIVLMVFDHLLYDLSDIFGITLPGFIDFMFTEFRLIFAFTFVAIAGISCNFSKNNIKRGLILMVLAFGLSVVTHFVIPSQAIYFGVLHFYGVGIIIVALLKPLLVKVTPVVGVIVSAVLYILTTGVKDRAIGFFSFQIAKLPDFLYQSDFLFFLGLKNRSFRSADYFPIFPWIFALLVGFYIGTIIKDKTLPEFTYNKHSKILLFAGTHSLIVYLVHQPIIYGVLYLLFEVIGK